jgi:hypothetical protein
MRKRRLQLFICAYKHAQGHAASMRDKVASLTPERARSMHAMRRARRSLHRSLHRVMERRATARHTHRPADPAPSLRPDAERRWRCAAEHRDNLVVGVVAVAGFGVELPGWAEAPPARVPLVPVLALLRGRAAAGVASGTLLARACARALLAAVREPRARCRS